MRLCYILELSKIIMDLSDIYVFVPCNLVKYKLRSQDLFSPPPERTSFKVPVKWNFRLLFYSKLLKSLILWFEIFESGLRTSAYEFFLELQSWPIRVKMCDIPRTVKICNGFNKVITQARQRGLGLGLGLGFGFLFFSHVQWQIAIWSLKRMRSAHGIYRSCRREKLARNSMISRAMKSHTNEHTVRGGLH